MAVTLVATGGTIASTPDTQGHVTATLTGADLLARLPSDLPEQIGGVEIVDLPVPGSWNLSTARAAEVAATVALALDQGAAGVVVTHGTDVIEETMWLTEVLVRPYRPDARIVFTASMRHADEFGYEGARNLADALRLAASAEASDLGTVLCVNGEVHAARWVTKTHTTAIGTFESPGRGPLVEVGSSGFRVLRAGPRPPAPQLSAQGPWPLSHNVPVLMGHWDADPELIGWHRGRGAAGFVIEAGGAGNVCGGLVPGVTAALDDGLPVVVASRCRRGRVEPIYGGAGGFATLAAAGAIGSGGLTAAKARLSLMVALAAGADPAGVRSAFTEPDPRMG